MPSSDLKVILAHPLSCPWPRYTMLALSLLLILQHAFLTLSQVYDPGVEGGPFGPHSTCERVAIACKHLNDTLSPVQKTGHDQVDFWMSMGFASVTSDPPFEGCRCESGVDENYLHVPFVYLRAPEDSPLLNINAFTEYCEQLGPYEVVYCFPEGAPSTDQQVETSGKLPRGRGRPRKPPVPKKGRGKGG